jgi:hypothetical protein
MRSTNAPTISAGVMIAKVIWNMKKTVSGMVVLGARVCRPTPLRKALLKPPIHGVPGANARL